MEINAADVVLCEFFFSDGKGISLDKRCRYLSV